MVLKDKRYITLFLAPAVILVAAFLYYPLFSTFYYSLTDWRDFSVLKNFIGLENYKTLIADPVIHIALKNTLILMVGAVIFQVGTALVLALMVDSIKVGYKFFRTAFFFPVVISGTAIGLLFYLTYGYEYGLLNAVISLFGKEKQVWLTEKSAIWLVLIPVIWQYVGFYFVIFLTAITKVPTDIYESALLDGITGIKKAIYITIPLIWEVIAINITLVITGVFKVFEVVYVITGGGPVDSSHLLSTYMNLKTFTGQNQGYGCTIAVLMMVIGLGLALISNKVTERERVTY